MDEDKCSLKIVEHNEIYIFIVENLFIWDHLGSQIFVKSSRIYFKNTDTNDTYINMIKFSY